EGPKTRAEIVAYVEGKRTDAPADRLYWRTDAALSKLREKGLVRRVGSVWAGPERPARRIKNDDQ
ncbi:hypothetical protein AB9K41_06770, partial [Cribrihabitans sp. XS_ASV171]